MDWFPSNKRFRHQRSRALRRPVSRLAERAGVPARSYKRRGDGLDCLAAEQYLQAASRRHPSFVLPRVVRPAQKVLPSLDWIRRHYWGVTHQHRQVEHQRTTNEEGKIRCMRSRSCFWWPPTGNQFNPALQSVSICLISCSVSVTSECKRREENRNLLMVCGFAL